MDGLIRFLNIDADARRDAEAIWPLIECGVSDIIGKFYADVMRSDIDVPLSEQTIDHLKIRQKEHWRALFESRFDEAYFNSASLIGIKHCEMGVDPKWYIAGYAKIKSDFSNTLLNASLPLPEKIALVATLDKYVALDMALAISSYTSLLVD